ncbi:hypothetical protein AB3X52_01420 [Nocardioides sp. DS6]|uniref:Uncharacterized protein n=1 Tax=Nocardioides eburneus TaxID=3231482 RepID=A0ABV3STJ4_9ACTN
MNRKLQLGRDDYHALGMGGLEGVWARFLTIAVGIVLALACIAIVPRRRLPITHLGAFTLYVCLLHVVIRRVLLALNLLPHAANAPELIALVLGATALALMLPSAPVRLVTRPLVEPVWLRDMLRRPSRTH